MPTPLAPVLLSTPMVERATLLPTRPWALWLQASFVRQGGQEALTNTELASGIGSNSGAINDLQDDIIDHATSIADLESEVTTLQTLVIAQQAQIDTLITQVATLEATVATQTTDIAALQASVLALETWVAAMQAALPATVSTTDVPTLADAPATADALRDDLTANWQGTLNSNDNDLEARANGIRTALLTVL